MSRSPRARQADVAERIRLFAEHHIVAVRTQRRTGEIVAVKHLAWGWISPKEYYLMQEIHRVLPDLISKTIEGGYRLKEAIWGTDLEFEVLATGVRVPAAVAIVAGATALATVHHLQGNDLLAALDLAALALPFGEIYLLYQGVLELTQLNDAIKNAVGSALGVKSTDELKMRLENANWWPF